MYGAKWHALSGVLVCLFAASREANAQIRITEVLPVASAASEFPDEDGSAQGWIELWNSDQATTITLTGYKLGNGTSSWTLPNIQILADERIIIWASAKNRVNPEAPLHTNFKLSAAGGPVTLSDSGNVLLSSLQTPALAPDISWGRDEWDVAVTPTLVGSYATPTPAARNNYSGNGVAGKVVIGTSSRAFTTSFNVTLSTTSTAPGTVIRYTTDLSVPTASSTAYTAAIPVSSTKMIRARVFADNLLPGETASEAYLLLDSTAASFTSTMPLVVVTNFLSAAPSTDKSDQPGFMWTWQPASTGAIVRFTDTPTTTARVSLGRRGSSTLGNPKFNLTIEARNVWDDDELDVPLLGMTSHSDWIFHAPYNYDPALLRNPFIHDLSNQIGHWAPHHKMAEVFLGFSGTALRSSGATNEYFGIYNILEEIGRAKSRQNLEKLTTYDNDAVKKTGGYLWKIDRTDSIDAFTAGSVSLVYDYPKGEAMKSPQRDPQEKYLKQYLDAFNTAATALNHDPVTGYPAYLDVTATIDHHLFNVWAFNVDGLRLSAFWHKDRNGKFAAGPTWDFDRAMYSKDGRDSDPALWRSDSADLGTDFFNGSGDTRRWWHYLFRDIDFYQQYIDRWQELRRGSFSASNINSLLDSLNAEMSSDAISRDLLRWKQSKRSWTSPFTGQVYAAGQAAEVQRIKDFMQQRANFFDTQWVGQVNASLAPGHVTAGTSVALTGPADSVIYYTIDGSDPRPPGGAVPTAANVKTYTAPIPIGDLTRIRARAYKSTHSALTGANNPPLMSKWGGSRDLNYTTRALAGSVNLTITEINHQPAAPTTAELAVNATLDAGSFGFIELRNTSSESVDLTGAAFSAGITYTFPGGSPVLAPGQYLIVAANPAAFAIRYPSVTNVTGPWLGALSNDGELLALNAADTLPIVSLTFSKTWSSLADGNGYSLVCYDEKAGTASYGLAENWRTSATVKGSPGYYDSRSKQTPAAAKLLHYWNFNTGGTLLEPNKTIGGGTLTIPSALPNTFSEAGSAQNFSGENARNSDPVGSHLRLNYPIASSLTFALPTTHYQNIVARYETRRSGSGAGTQRVSYTLDGSTYLDFRNHPVSDGTPGIEKLDFSAIGGASGNPLFGIRIVFEQGLGGTVGNNRFDHFTVEGNPIPHSGADLLHYALGIESGQTSGIGFPTLAADGHGLRFNFDAGKTDIAYRVQRSIDLETWTVIFDSRVDSWQPYLINGQLEIPDPDPPEGRAYYRLAIIQD